MTLIVGELQLDSTSDKGSLYPMAEEYVKIMSGKGARILCLHELFHLKHFGFY